MENQVVSRVRSLVYAGPVPCPLEMTETVIIYPTSIDFRGEDRFKVYYDCASKVQGKQMCPKKGFCPFRDEYPKHLRENNLRL